jgi:hypothetical protein
MVLMDDLDELLPHLPALRPPWLCDLAAGVLMELLLLFQSTLDSHEFIEEF